MWYSHGTVCRAESESPCLWGVFEAVTKPAIWRMNSNCPSKQGWKGTAGRGNSMKEGWEVMTAWCISRITRTYILQDRQVLPERGRWEKRAEARSQITLSAVPRRSGLTSGKWGHRDKGSKRTDIIVFLSHKDYFVSKRNLRAWPEAYGRGNRKKRIHWGDIKETQSAALGVCVVVVWGKERQKLG